MKWNFSFRLNCLKGNNLSLLGTICHTFGPTKENDFLPKSVRFRGMK